MYVVNPTMAVARRPTAVDTVTPAGPTYDTMRTIIWPQRINNTFSREGVTGPVGTPFPDISVHVVKQAFGTETSNGGNTGSVK